MEIRVTDRAATFLRRMILFNGGNPQLTGLRLFVKEGGCSGLSYDFSITEVPTPGDLVLNAKNCRLFIPESSRPFLNGMEIDCVDNLMNTGLVFNNPNAQGQCGCGTSFNVAGGPPGAPGSCSKQGSSSGSPGH